MVKVISEVCDGCPDYLAVTRIKTAAVQVEVEITNLSFASRPQSTDTLQLSQIY